MEQEKKCKDKVSNALKSRMDDITKLWDAEKNGIESGVEGLGTFNEYGLSFDYVASGTFNGQRRGYFRYQISYGGPSEEFRFYCTEGFNIDRIEFWYLDWFDGAKRILHGKNLETMEEIFNFFKECETVEYAYKEAINNQ